MALSLLKNVPLPFALYSPVLEAFLPLQVWASFFLNFVRQLFKTAFVVLDISLGAGVPRLVSGLGTSFLPLCLFGFEVLRGSRACSVGVLHFLRFPLFSYLALRTSMGPGRSSVLRIGINPGKASSLG